MAVGARSRNSPLHRLEHGLAPWVGFLILPVFGFANAGVSLDGLGAAALLAPLPLGIALGLFLGKQLAIFGAVRLCRRLAPRRPAAGRDLAAGLRRRHALRDRLHDEPVHRHARFPGRPVLVEEAKLGMLLGSVLSALGGYLLLRLAPRPRGKGRRRGGRRKRLTSFRKAQV